MRDIKKKMPETRPYIMEDQRFGFINMDINIDSQD